MREREREADKNIWLLKISKEDFKRNYHGLANT